MRGLALALMLLAGPAGAAEPTLADLKTDLAALTTGLQSLRAELLATGAKGYAAAGGDSAIDRMNALEAGLRAATGRLEAAEARVNAASAALETKADDLAFRLCEMDQTCELGALTTPQTGGEAAVGAGPTPTPATMTEAETLAWAAAQAVLPDDPAKAAEMFSALAKGPLRADALVAKAGALTAAGDADAAGQAWLDAFSADPSGPRAPDALAGIAGVLEAGGKPREACETLADLAARFPQSAANTAAEAQRTRLACGD